MFELSKKQVGAVIKVLEKNKDVRPLLSHMMIDRKNENEPLVVIVTDGFTMSILNAGMAADEHADLIGKGVPVDALKRWYATADSKDTYTADDIVRDATDLPQPIMTWKNIIPTTPAPIDRVALNPHLMLCLETIAQQPLVYTTYGEGRPLVAKQFGDTYVLMPIMVR